MSYNLTAKLELKDKMSRKLKLTANEVKRVRKQVDQVKRSTDQYSQSTDKLQSRLRRATKAGRDFVSVNRKMFGTMRNAMSGIGGLRGQFVGLAAAIGGAYTAKTLFDKTIGQAAQHENSQILINAMFNDDGKAQKFMKDMQKLAEDSPVLNSQDMFSNAKSFISISKDVDKLGDMYRLVEKLNVLDPQQGVQGAVIALREFLGSSDTMSLRERFEMPRKELNALKGLSLSEQIKGFNKLLKQMGITDETINEVGQSTLSLWNQIKEKTDRILRTLGQPALATIRDFLDDINRRMDNSDMSGFIRYGQNILDSIADGFIGSTTSLGKYIDRIANDHNFQKLTTLNSKVDFVFSDINKKFTNWLNNGGQEKINKASERLIDITATSIESNIERISKVGQTVGGALGKGIVVGAKNYVKENWQSVLDFLMGGILFKDMFKDGETTRKSILGKNNSIHSKNKGPSKASGLSYVPRNGMQYTLHKGERILTPEENREYTNGINGVNIAKLADHIVVREESDIDKLATQLAIKIKSAGQLGV